MLFDTSNLLQKEQFKARSAKLAESGKIVELTEKKPPRGIQANKYLHVILAYFASEIGETMEYVKKNYYKILCNKDTFVREREDKFLGKIKYLRSSADLDSAELSLTIERFRNFASSEAGVYIPASDEYKLLELAEIEIDRNKEFV